ncbi:MAG TPA: DUF6438 domain-containing protein [Rhizomicrobium sp.]|nr:DUF6438 domain-containing protein [Rhizomicrobium sp.]
MCIFLLAAIAVLVLSLVPKLGEYGPHKRFPEVRNWESVTIRLERSLCYGTCPSYSVELHGDGTVLYDGRDCVAIMGPRTGHVPAAAVVGLVQQFRNADYFSLKENYVASITDGPTFRTSIGFDGHSKSVGDYLGESAGMPAAVEALERAIDKTTGTDRWVWGGKRTCFGRPVDDTPLKRRP